MDYTRKSTTTYILNNNIIKIIKTKYYKRRCVYIVQMMSLVEFKKHKNKKHI